MDPCGRVYIREIGHVGFLPHIKESFRSAQELKPLVDILENEKEVRVVAELPRVCKEKIKVMGKERNLAIYINRQGKPLLNLNLPCSVVPEIAKATLKNGVLEVILKKGNSFHSESNRINVQ